MAQAAWEALASSTISRKTVTAAWLFWRAKVLTVGPRGAPRVQARCLVATGPNSSRSASLRVANAPAAGFATALGGSAGTRVGRAAIALRLTRSVMMDSAMLFICCSPRLSKLKSNLRLTSS